MVLDVGRLDKMEKSIGAILLAVLIEVLLGVK
jgi:hypothetical protein